MNDPNLPDDQDPLDREENFAPGWRPAEGEIVRGEIVDIGLVMRDASYGGGEYVVITLKLAPGYSASTAEGTVDDRVAIHLLHAQLVGRLAALEPKIADEIGVKFVGEPLGSGRSKRYRVDKSRDGGGKPSPVVNWDEYKFPDDRADSGADLGVGEPLPFDSGDDDARF